MAMVRAAIGFNIVGSSESRNKIRQWFKKEKREENISKGREFLERESKKLGYDWKELTKGERLTDVGKKFNIQNEDDLMPLLVLVVSLFMGL